MAVRIDDLRIRAVRPLLPPAILAEELPAGPRVAETISKARTELSAALVGTDHRIVVVVGPCSVHDVDAAKVYADRLQPEVELYREKLIIVMRAYFEKPRTTVGWKGLLNDPDIDESFNINKGLRLARGLLLHLAEMAVPAGTEFLDMTTPQHLADLVTWGAIGARTTESQTHRELASGLSMPVGFKNATDGNTRVAIDAVKAARQPHWFPGTTKDGISAILQTTGNDACHVILRGGSRTGPNYESKHIMDVSQALEQEGLPARLLVDFSHGNSSKNHLRQLDVCNSICHQIADEGSPIFGVMIESFLEEGRQDYVAGATAFGRSITDACLSFEQTRPLLEQLANAR